MNFKSWLRSEIPNKEEAGVAERAWEVDSYNV